MNLSRNIKLSYVITTFNKLSYLKVTLPYLVKACKDDEEIIIVDGGSTDGTFEFLKNLFNEGKIHQFISEKDKGEAHGTNKAILMANGELIKIITDDDVYDYEIIHKCKEFMLINPQVDVIAGNILQHNLNNKKEQYVIFSNYFENEYVKWRDKIQNNCFLCGLTIMLRRTSLPLLGLFNTNLKHIDIEYSVRITSLGANIMFCNKSVSLAIVNLNSNSFLYQDSYNLENLKVSFFYNYFTSEPNNYFYNPYSVKESIKFLLFKFYTKLIFNKPKKDFLIEKKTIRYNSIENNNLFENAYLECLNYIKMNNEIDEIKFL
ncbi:MAG: hypothetical protein A2046_14230 [Bacteroidetes bacterium GWA2_30_7]|nr:MAG: hypothetical protein A2046_14230 [Bacteroidetes bacterium GWA2_30_7]